MIVSAVPMSLKIISFSKILFEMSGNLMAWYVAFHSPCFGHYQPMSVLCLDVDRKRLVSVFFLVSYHIIIMPFRFGTCDVDHSLDAKLDLEMPGTNKWRTYDYRSRSIKARKVTVTSCHQFLKLALPGILMIKCS